MKMPRIALTLVVLTHPMAVRADEGMWTYDNVPTKQMKDKLGFEPSGPWLDHLRLASVRFKNGSGSFVGPNGLILTARHVVSSQLRKIESSGQDFRANGFLARSKGEEIPCPDLGIVVLMGMENVTGKIRSAVKPGMSQAQASAARKEAIDRLEKATRDATGCVTETVRLFQGSETWIYRYKESNDVRLVFVPDWDTAYFGTDPDNDVFPRFNLDMAVLRVYENGKPLRPTQWLKLNRKGPADGEAVFTSGNPGATQRLNTMAQLELKKTLDLPLDLLQIRRASDAFLPFAGSGSNEAKAAASFIDGYANWLKGLEGIAKGLEGPGLLERKAKEEAVFRGLVAGRPEWQAAYGSAWDELAAAEARRRDLLKMVKLRTLGLRGFRGLGDVATELVRCAAETAKPDGARADGYHDADLVAVRQRLLATEARYPALEEASLANDLRTALDALGAEDPWVKAALGGRLPEAVAKEAVAETKLADPAVRKALLDGGQKAVEASTDPFLAIARKVQPLDLDLAKRLAEQAEGVEASAGERIGLAHFAIHGKDAYPDANYTLRFGFGTVRGYPMNGTVAPSKTTLFGLYDRAASFDGKAPFNLPKRFLEGRDRLNLATPYNFVADLDTSGGSSGSPVVNRAGELVGLVFDGNMEAQVGDTVYDGTANRTIAVHSAGMTEILSKLYHAEFLLKELEGQ